MSDETGWSFPAELQPRIGAQRFDLVAALDAVVGVRTEIPADAFTASVLGTERAGNGVVIGKDGLVLTIGYLVTEAQTIWLTTNSGKLLPGHVLGYDQETGFGLVQALGRLDVPALPQGSIAAAKIGDDVIVIGQGGQPHALSAKIIGRREFAGYWEYLLDEALFTAPAHPQWGGAAVVDMDGRLLGIGSLLVEERTGGKAVQGNMIVPIDLLAPILQDMLTLGRARAVARPWLGLYAGETQDELVVAGMAKRGPAERAGLREGDAILEVAGEKVASLADFFRHVWRLGPAGTEIPLTVARRGATLRAVLRSADRSDFLKKPSMH